IRDFHVTGVQTCALPISAGNRTATRPWLGSTNRHWPPPAIHSETRPQRYEGQTHCRYAGPYQAWCQDEYRHRTSHTRSITTAGRSEERRVGKEGRLQWLS